MKSGRGLLCPHCDAWTEVKETRHKPDGYLRTRACANGHRFMTIEKVVESLPHGGDRRTEAFRQRRVGS